MDVQWATQGGIKNGKTKTNQDSFLIDQVTLPNGDRYVGSYIDDKMHGGGTYTFANGDEYIGNFVDGKIRSKALSKQQRAVAGWHSPPPLPRQRSMLPSRMASSPAPSAKAGGKSMESGKGFAASPSDQQRTVGGWHAPPPAPATLTRLLSTPSRSYSLSPASESRRAPTELARSQSSQRSSVNLNVRKSPVACKLESPGDGMQRSLNMTLRPTVIFDLRHC